ncbi:MAG TPA: hypothetical protein VFB21_01600 [Chthonomonadaceae bacterium]|nr:hypothetical protein [Chthonomonadaceae bacterium]
MSSKRFRSLQGAKVCWLMSLLAAAALAGCGGGSGSPGANNLVDSGGKTFQFGSLSGRAVATNPPITVNGSGATVTALKGDISSLILKDPAPNLAETRIAFSRYQDGNYELYTMNADGSNQVRLTNSPGDDIGPCWRPDGARIVFASKRTGNYQIYEIPANGGTTLRLTNNAFSDIQPCYSPDGSKIVFSTNRDGNYEIYVMNADGSSPVRRTNDTSNDDYEPRWSPDGSKIAWAKKTGNVWEIWVMDANGLNQHQLTHDNVVNHWPAWSPDSTRIAFHSFRNQNSDVYVINSDGDGTEARLTTDPNNDTEPSWSSDGAKIAFNSGRDGNSEVYVMNADGSDQTRLTNHIASDVEPAWGPFIRQRTLIGTGSVFGTPAANGAAGFLFSRGYGSSSALYGGNGEVINSIVLFDGNPRSGVLVSSPSGANNLGPELVFTVEADSPNTLSFLALVNLPDYRPNWIVGANASIASANGVLIDFSSTTGKITAILPYTGVRLAGSGKPAITEEGGQRVVRGSFLGVWDGTGKNLAPHGAKEVRLDVQKGAVVLIK